MGRYLVKWVDLSYKDCTWEKRDVITDKEMIEAYEQRQRVPEWKLAPLKSKAERVALGEKSMLKFKEGKVSASEGAEAKTLRPYQWEGFRWLKNNYNEGKNSILADEMGLGKTIQVISLMEHVVHKWAWARRVRRSMQTQQPILVIAPLSTLGFWRREIESWTSLNVIMYHDNEGGKEVRRLIEKYEWYYGNGQVPESVDHEVFKFDVLLTTYEITIADVDALMPVAPSLMGEA